jgi:hypothetical protein
VDPFFLKAKTIADAWFQLIYNIFDNSYTQRIQKGSFEEEQYRLQYPGIGVYIEHPSEDMVPVIPPALGIPSPTTMEYIEDYFANYLMDPELSENETYKYASRIHHPMPDGGTQLERAVSMLKETPLTNQAVVEVGAPEDFDVCVESWRHRAVEAVRRERSRSEEWPHVRLQRRCAHLRIPGRTGKDTDAEEVTGEGRFRVPLLVLWGRTFCRKPASWILSPPRMNVVCSCSSLCKVQAFFSSNPLEVVFKRRISRYNTDGA